MSESRFLERKDRHIKLFILVTILGILTVFLIGCLSVELSPVVYITIFSAIFIITIMSLILRNINIAVYLLIILLPIANISFVLKPSSLNISWILFTPLDILTVSAIICLLLYKSIFKDRTSIAKEKTGPGYLSLLLFTLIAFCILSVLWSPEIHIGLSFCIKLFLNFLMYLLLVILIKKQKDIIRALRVLIFISMITAITMLISVFPIEGISKEFPLTNELAMNFYFETYRARASGIIETHVGAVFLSICILFNMGLLSQSKEKKEKILLIIIIIFLIWAVLYTKARGPIASLLFGMTFIIFAIKNFRTYLFRNLFMFAICFIFLFSIFIVTHRFLLDYIEPSLGRARVQSEHSLSDRFEYWEKAYNAITKNDAYIQGLGAGGSTYYLYPVLHTHNIYLSIFFDFGLIGVILFSILISISITKIILTIRNLKEGFAKAMLLSTLGCIIALGFSSLVDFYYNLHLLWFLMGIGVAIYRYAVSIQKETMPLSKSVSS